MSQLRASGTVRPIVRWSESVLHTPAQPVTDFGPDLQALLADMFATNTAAEGAGLAAAQVGVGLAVFVYDCTDENGKRRAGVICNPELELPQGDERRLVELTEGCLSYPGGYAPLARPSHATCRGRDHHGEPVTVTAAGILGRCLQHETDHINGMVFGDRLSARGRRQMRTLHEEAVSRYPDDWPVSPAAPRD